VNVGPECYPNPILADASKVLSEALTGGGAAGFDASDQMPAAVQGAFWTGMVEYLQNGPDALPGILDEIEASWPSKG
jgi:hypothetical protein